MLNDKNRVSALKIEQSLILHYHKTSTKFLWKKKELWVFFKHCKICLLRVLGIDDNNLNTNES